MFSVYFYFAGLFQSANVAQCEQISRARLCCEGPQGMNCVSGKVLVKHLLIVSNLKACYT